MTRILLRGLLGAATAVLITAGSTGLASAADLPSPPPLPGVPDLPGSGAGVPIWALPGVDLGSVLGPTVPVPTDALAPVDGLLTQITG